MRPLMYKQRPAYPALIAALFILIIGAWIIFELHQRVDTGEESASSVVLAYCMTFGIVGTLVVSAFARYQFTHLWKKPDPSVSRNPRKRQHQSRRR